MVMHKVLLVLFIVANAIAVLLMTVAYVLNIIARIRKSAMATANVNFPVLSEQHSLIKHCYWSGTLFIILNWLLCSSNVLDLGLYRTNAIATGLLVFAVLWALMIFFGAIAEIVIRCFKSADSSAYSVLGGIKSSIWFSVLYFVLSFLLA